MYTCFKAWQEIFHSTSNFEIKRKVTSLFTSNPLPNPFVEKVMYVSTFLKACSHMDTSHYWPLLRYVSKFTNALQHSEAL